MFQSSSPLANHVFIDCVGLDDDVDEDADGDGEVVEGVTNDGNGILFF